MSSEYAKYIDSTILKPEATAQEIRALCQETQDYGFKSVCINPTWVGLAAKLLQGSPVAVCTVVGFPLGATSTASKAFETQQAIADGATEIDMVINIGNLKDGAEAAVKNDIAAVKKACGDKILKVIIECCLLTDEEKVKACQLAVAAQADFVKTSTGFSKGGATVADVALMRHTVGPDLGVKAAGGIKTKQDMLDLLKAGATRIGTSHGVELIK